MKLRQGAVGSPSPSPYFPSFLRSPYPLEGSWFFSRWPAAFYHTHFQGLSNRPFPSFLRDFLPLVPPFVPPFWERSLEESWLWWILSVRTRGRRPRRKEERRRRAKWIFTLDLIPSAHFSRDPKPNSLSISIVPRSALGLSKLIEGRAQNHPKLFSPKVSRNKWMQ